MTLKDFATRLQPRLHRFFDRKITEYGSATLDPLLSELFSYPRHLLNAGGKRVRPYMAAVMYEAAGGKLTDEVLDVLVGLEFFHLFALVHDDIIDRGTERHGIPTIHAFAERAMRAQHRLGNIPHVANGQAMLVGDLLFSWACEAFEGANVLARDMYPRASTRFRQMVDEVVVGQMIDVDLMTRDRATTVAIERKMLLKTATYTFIRPMQIGVALAGGDARLEVFADTFGTAMGLAFQIQDDYLELVSPSDVIKKPAFTDIADREHTLFTQHIFEHGTPAQQELLRSVFGKPVPPEQHEAVRTLLRESGALAAGEQRMHALFGEAERLLEQASLPASSREQLRDLLAFIRSRTS
jgi:geranylgeranyl diphosphate synthase type I